MSVSDPRSPLSRTDGPASRVRWAMVVLLFVFYTINCVDRAALSVAMPLIGAEFQLSGTVKGLILSSFFWTYCLLQIPGGLAVDRFGPRRVIGVASFIWGSFMALAGLASNATMLILSRVGLGAFEAPFMSSASKIVAQWIPRDRRASGITLIDSGAPLGAAVGGLLVAWLIGATGSWRMSFVVIGVFTVLFGIGATLWIRNRPQEHAGVNPAELAIIEAGAAVEGEKPGVGKATVVAMVVGRLCWAMVFWGLVTWGPSYLAATRGLDLKALGWATFVIFLCGAMGEILSGVLADRLQRRLRRNVAFKILFGGSGALSLAALLALPFVNDTVSAVALLCVGVCFNQFGGLYWTIPGMLAKPEQIGLVGGVMNFAGTSAGIIVPIVAGILVDTTGGYGAVLTLLTAAAAVYLVGSLCIDFEGKRISKDTPHA